MMKGNAAWNFQYGQEIILQHWPMLSQLANASCTPWVCNSFDTPLFNIGTSRVPKWVRISKFGEIIQSEAPQEFIPQ